jgi:hypothetical protein
MSHHHRIIAMVLAACPFAAASDSTVITRAVHETSGVVWDMPSPLAAAPGQNRAMIRKWRVTPRETELLGQQLVGPFLPTATIKVTTLDFESAEPRTRVDQPFTIDVHLGGLLTEGDFPRNVSSVLLERQASPADSAEIRSDHAWLGMNGSTVLRFPASSLTAGDPTKAEGTETFLVHALSGEKSTQGPIASARIRVLPVASAEIRGLRQGELVNRRAPKIQLVLRDLYPKSQTSLILYEGREINGNPGITVKSLVTDRKDPLSTTLRVEDFSAHMTTNGTYTLALVSETVYGRELLCAPVTFEVQRPPRMTKPLPEVAGQAAR